jgi:hypothetical protein
MINGFVYDRQDAGEHVSAERLLVTDTVMKDEADRVRLADEVLAWALTEGAR